MRKSLYALILLCLGPAMTALAQQQVNLSPARKLAFTQPISTN